MTEFKTLEKGDVVSQVGKKFVVTSVGKTEDNIKCANLMLVTENGRKVSSRTMKINRIVDSKIIIKRRKH